MRRHLHPSARYSAFVSNRRTKQLVQRCRLPEGWTRFRGTAQPRYRDSACASKRWSVTLFTCIRTTGVEPCGGCTINRSEQQDYVDSVQLLWVWASCAFTSRKMHLPCRHVGCFLGRRLWRKPGENRTRRCGVKESWSLGAEPCRMANRARLCSSGPTTR